ncbi:MAG: choice-of-anchor V domain-containing protein, partial [Candidatus Thermoplasmatota archaeon]|nr:choice-of-anchor V domain-containing protein [Candidatus Thermoplasmatota archaeon]
MLMVMVLAVPEGAFAYSSGKTDSSTTGCGGGSCHGSTNTVTPTLTTGIPSSGYTPGTVYSLTIGGSGGVSGTKGGFNLDASSGTFSNPGTNAQIVSGEVTHSNSNARTWTVDWTAPSTGTGDVTFLLAVNFANGNGGATGDSWGTDSWIVSELTTSNSNPPLPFNQPGSQRGSVFTHSIFEMNSGSPTIVLNNGTRVTFSTGTGGGQPVYTNDDMISLAGDCALLDNYSLRCTGPNNYGQLGLGSFSLSNGTVDFGSHQTAAISDGNNHNCVIITDGSVKCWGRNNLGQLGDGSNTNRNAPVSVNLGTNTTAVAISSGTDFTCAITNSGAVKCWGFNGYGNLGDGTTNDSNTPVEANHSTGMRAVAISTPGYGVCALFENGSIYCWGQTYTVSSLNGPVTNGSVQIDIPTGRSAEAIDGISSHMCAILDNGSINCWGVNTYGQWGDGTCSSVIASSGCTGENSNTPVYASLSSGRTAISISAGTDSTCAILDDYSVQCWGRQSGEFDGTTDDLLTPHTMNFTSGAEVAYSDQDMDGDTVPNIFDTHMTGDDDGDGVSGADDPYPNNPTRWMDCDPGYWGRLSCSPAGPGHFAITGDLYHQPCIAGAYQPSYGYNMCYESSAGNYVPVDQATSQTLCSPGMYQEQVGQTSCVNSAAGNFSNQNFGDAGSYNSSAFNISANSALYNGSIHSSGDLQDLFVMNVPRESGVSVGLTSPSGADFDIAIYDENLNLLNSSYTTAYDETSTNNTNFSSDSKLYILVSPWNGTGQYQLQVWLFSTLDGAVVGDPNLSIEVEMGVTDYQCTPGNFQPNTGQSSCIDAAPGHFVDTSGSTTQSPCTPGSFQSAPGQTYCIQATLGHYVDIYAAADQTPASPGHYVNTTGATSQESCTVGTYQPSIAQATCLDADAGHYVNTTGSASQTECYYGTYQPNTGQASCIDASAGYFVSITAATNQTACQVGGYQPSTGQSHCLPSDPGHYVNTIAATSQTPCDIGSFQPLFGSDRCNQADPGHYVANTGSANQTACDPGTFQPNSGASNCIDSPAGHYVETSAATSPTPCSSGTYNPSLGSSSADDCLDSNPGYSVPSAGSSYQTPCTPGHYQPASGQISCLEADAGYFVPSSGAASQTPCTPGTYTANTSQSACNQASPGHYVSAPGSTYQDACSIGTYNPQSGSVSASDCSPADAGNYVPMAGAADQVPCAEGTYQPSIGQSSCIMANPGHYVPGANYQTQLECQLGSFQQYPGSSSCTLAEPGHYVDSIASDTQKQCPPTTYNPETGSDDRDDCTDVEPGHYASEWGTPEQIECALGTYQPNSAQSTCLEADPGYFVSSLASTSQSPCPAGTYNPLQSSGSAANCMPADSGYFVDNQASPTQTACSPGTYQDSSGQLSCIDASPGNYVSSEGQSEQIPAPLDSYVTGSASTSYEECPENHITLQEGAISSNDCYLDSDGDRIQDASDPDDDNDGVNDGMDMCPLGLMGWSSSVGSDFDGDGCKDIEEDSDDDNDGFPDDNDALPLNQAEWIDSDMDGIGDNADTDDDNDGLSDTDEDAAGTDPKDSDTDDDGFNDGVDVFPLNPVEWADSDGDGYGDNEDAFPNDASKYLEEDIIAKYGLVIALAVGMLVVGLGGWMVMRRRGDSETTPASEQTQSVVIPQDEAPIEES